MTDIRFYHLQRQSLVEALPKLLEKASATGAQIVIKTPDKATMEQLDKALWSYDRHSFLAHGSEGTKLPQEQPIYLTTADDNPSEATIQVLINAAASEHTDAFNMCLYMFDGRDEVIVQAARASWKKFSGGDHNMSYWQQRETGGWEQKA